MMSNNVQHVFRILLCFEIFSDFSTISFEVSVSPCFSTVLFTTRVHFYDLLRVFFWLRFSCEWMAAHNEAVTVLPQFN